MANDTLSFKHNCGVDSGSVSLIKLSTLKDKYQITQPKPFLATTFKIPAGKYKAVLKTNAWNGRVQKTILIDIDKEEEFYLGDFCYLFDSQEEWTSLIKETNHFKNTSKDMGIVLRTGGDGYFGVSVTFEKI